MQEEAGRLDLIPVLVRPLWFALGKDVGVWRLRAVRRLGFKLIPWVMRWHKKGNFRFILKVRPRAAEWMVVGEESLWGTPRSLCGGHPDSEAPVAEPGGT